ncbi:hypothetical protein [Paenibacillus aceris]|uniref:DUF2577 domain-containing protein n=1 Tax=Paenibacillus aceris TaxID=869555 RepID=A0ABS4HSF9_9BACL|nr:hypothetical protein [Paenibacillus aceris]MBP1961331.1 hypothetical protein [Paenibacillus aceris]NHW37884.1 hypothetical protein [Paenibacillus aceris]
MRVSSKFLTISMLQSFIMKISEPASESNQPLNDFKAILLTNLGQIEAEKITLDTPESHVRNDNGKVTIDLSFIATMKGNYLDQEKKKDEQFELIGDGSTVTLENATLILASNPNIQQHYHQLVLFSDQIIGFSITNKMG